MPDNNAIGSDHRARGAIFVSKTAFMALLRERGSSPLDEPDMYRENG
jgi:hypothetical protein